MKNFFFTAVLTAGLSINALAQLPDGDHDPNINNNNPHTETAFLNYDFKFQQSGFERVDGGMINVQPGVRGLLKFHLEPTYDYTFVGVTDSIAGGMSISGKPETFEGNVFTTDSLDVYKEEGANLIVITFPAAMLGDVVVQPMLLGKAVPKESSYYLLMRKKSAY
jgi:hypothetical protein